MKARDLPHQDLEMLNRIVTSLNQSMDTRAVLDRTLSELLEIMNLETGWIFLRKEDPKGEHQPVFFELAAHQNLPPAMRAELDHVWEGSCTCQDLLIQGTFDEAYTEVECSRLAAATGNRFGLQIHASTPLRSGDQLLGILNLAASTWKVFKPEKLALLSNVGNQLGIALERARLYEQLKVRFGTEQSMLLSLSNQLLERKSLNDLMNFLVREIPKQLDIDACALLLPNPDKKTLTFHAVEGWRSNPISEKRSIPIDASTGPGQVMQSGEPLIIEDLRAYDPTTWAPEWILREGFRGHAIFPLLVEGNSIGVLILDSRRVHSYDEDKIKFLQLIANQGAIAIEKARLQEEEIQRKSMEHELNLGRQIQLALLPEELPRIKGWDFAAMNLAAQQVGGDFYDCFQLPGPEGHYGFVMADVSGKGVPAALYMAMCRTIVRSIGISGRSPDQALKKANEIIHKDSRADLFVSIFYAHLDRQNGMISYANAGHNPPLLLRQKSGAIETLPARGIVLGAIQDVEIELGSMQMDRGDQLLLYTDGVIDAINPAGDRFGMDRFVKNFQDNHARPPREVLASLLDEIDHFSLSQPQTDDLTLLLIRRRA